MRRQNETSCRGCTLTDPIAHCVTTQDCHSDTDCPSGTICATLPSAEDAGAWPSAVGRGLADACTGVRKNKRAGASRCQLPRGRSERYALAKGFQVSSFALERVVEPNSAVAFRWSAPNGTQLVRCALFACRPIVKQTAEYEGTPLFSIINHQQCVIASLLSTGRTGLFDLGSEAAEQALDGGAPRHAFVSELLAGCWAFGNAQIIAASTLESVPLDQVYDYQGFRSDTCTTTGATCVQADHSAGVCFPGDGGYECGKPCVSASDCYDATLIPGQQESISDAGADAADAAPESGPGDAGVGGGPTDAASPSWQCQLIKGHYVGYCVKGIQK